ncbi:hypothetical protein [Streptomyces sp. NPDC093093]|uniref:hypothetical protein n=1 Tax=Streptomyces sp. NPDC093093 TaxID=3366025 RepID=UPI0038263C19
MFKALIDQWTANQEQRREIAAERWEQEKRWLEEDRQERRTKEAAENRLLLQRQEEQRAEAERRKETDAILTRWHLDVMKRAAAVSYVSLVCHEDTWTFLAHNSFGNWAPAWITSTVQERAGRGGPGPKDRPFSKDPKLSVGRITKFDNGLQRIEVSGDNLVRILDKLWDSSFGSHLFVAMTDTSPHRAWCGPLYKRFSDWLDEVDALPTDALGHSLVLDERIPIADPR